MIPDHIIEKALHAYYAGAGASHSTEAGMRSALEAVAADIWQEGVNYALPNQETHWISKHNPYRIEHT